MFPLKLTDDRRKATTGDGFGDASLSDACSCGRSSQALQRSRTRDPGPVGDAVKSNGYSRMRRLTMRGVC